MILAVFCSESRREKSAIYFRYLLKYSVHLKEIDWEVFFLMSKRVKNTHFDKISKYILILRALQKCLDSKRIIVLRSCKLQTKFGPALIINES